MSASDAGRLNITVDGRRSNVAEPQWYPAGGGMERAVVFQPGYGDRNGSYGVHGLEIRWLLRGPNGGAQFVVYTGWVPGEKMPASLADLYPSGVDVGHHAFVPQYDGECSSGPCQIIGRDGCYYDGSGLRADELLARFLIEGEQVVWRELQEIHDELIVAPVGGAA